MHLVCSFCLRPNRIFKTKKRYKICTVCCDSNTATADKRLESICSDNKAAYPVVDSEFGSNVGLKVILT